MTAQCTLRAKRGVEDEQETLKSSASLARDKPQFLVLREKEKKGIVFHCVPVSRQDGDHRS